MPLPARLKDLALLASLIAHGLQVLPTSTSRSTTVATSTSTAPAPTNPTTTPSSLDPADAPTCVCVDACAVPRVVRRGGVRTTTSGHDRGEGGDDSVDGDGEVDVDDDGADVLELDLAPTTRVRPAVERSRAPHDTRFHPEPLACGGCDEVNPEFILRAHVGAGVAGGFVDGDLAPRVEFPVRAGVSVGSDEGVRVAVDGVVSDSVAAGVRGGVFVGPQIAWSPFDGVRLAGGASVGLGGGLGAGSSDVGPSVLVPVSLALRAPRELLGGLTDRPVDVVVGVEGGLWPAAKARASRAERDDPCEAVATVGHAPAIPVTWLGVTIGLSTDFVLPR